MALFFFCSDAKHKYNVPHQLFHVEHNQKINITQ